MSILVDGNTKLLIQGMGKTGQLHAGLSVRRVVRHLRDMCGQLVGALGFVIYLLHEDRTVAHPIAWEGVRDDDVGPVRVGEGPVGDAIVTAAKSQKRTLVQLSEVSEHEAAAILGQSRPSLVGSILKRLKPSL